MSHSLVVDQALVEKDPMTNDLKATAYFENYLYEITSDPPTVTAVDYTAKISEIIICTAAVTITLDPVSSGVKLYIKRTNGAVNIVGTIDGQTNLTLGIDNASVTLVYTTTWWIL